MTDKRNKKTKKTKKEFWHFVLQTLYSNVALLLLL